MVLTHILFVTFLSVFVFHLEADVIGPLLLNASLLVLTTDESTDWLVQVTELIDNVKSLFSFETVVTRSSNVEKQSILECLHSLLAPLVCIVFPAL